MDDFNKIQSPMIKYKIIKFGLYNVNPINNCLSLYPIL